MARKVFYSFHYQQDNWRTSQVRNIGTLERSIPAKDNDWETITKGGDSEIRKWINSQLNNRTCLIVLVGKETSTRRWIDYEIQTAWNRGLGVLGIAIHNLKDKDGQQSKEGKSPFVKLIIENGMIRRRNPLWLIDAFSDQFSDVVHMYATPNDSKAAYSHISKNIANWVEEAIKIRKSYL